MVLTINPVPVLSTATNNSTCGGSDGDATVTVTSAPTPYTYLWDDYGTQTTATANNLSSGLYMVIVTDANGCTATDSIMIYDTLTSVLNISFSNSIRIYPNPSKGMFVLTIDDLRFTDGEFTIYEMLGCIISKSEIVNRKHEI